VDVQKFPLQEYPQAVTACVLMNVSTDITKTYFVVGSAVELSSEDEPKEGYLRVYEIVESGGRKKLNLCASKVVPGSVYCVDACDGKLLAGVGNSVLLRQSRLT
jgi:DNA damage-binding protein 1